MMSTTSDNLARIQSRIATAATRSGRRPEEITLVAVTKYVDSTAARQLVAAGCRDLGESRPQDLWAKSADLADLSLLPDPRSPNPDPGVRWHLIGHLQRNKV